MRLKDFAKNYIFAPLDIDPGEWGQDAEEHNNGCGDLHLTARDMAKFRLLYLDGGMYRGKRILSEEWVQDSLKIYSEDAWGYRVGRNFKDIGYGYQWWSIRAGAHRYNLAWDHGGQQIALVHDQNMVIVATSYPYWLEHDDRAWRHEKQMLNLVADFIAELPAPGE
jgi:CubicO group peptidase (beta-lactamase class C family)